MEMYQKNADEKHHPDGRHMVGERGFHGKIAQKKFLLENPGNQGEFHGQVCERNQPGRGLCRPHDQSRLEISIVGM